MGRNIVVTGATGITGLAVCTALTAAGHTVIAVSSAAERLEPVDAEHGFVCDLTDEIEVGALVDAVGSVAPTIDGVVHLVGGWRGGRGTDDWNWLEPRLLTSLRLVTLGFADALAASDAGRLVVIGSASAAKPTWSGANYAVLKSAADAWVTALASGWRKAGTAAAVTLVVSSIGGDNGTQPAAIADRILTLWDEPAADLNGSHISLTAD